MTRGGKLKAKPDLGDNEVSVRYSGGEFKLRHLPPIVLSFLLPENYPSSRSPIIKIDSEWLTRHQVIKVYTTIKLKAAEVTFKGCF